MEGTNQVASSFSSSLSSSSSFTSELFGSREPPSPSGGIFGSIFGPSSKVLGRESLSSAGIDKVQDPSNESWKKETDPADDASRRGEGENQSMLNRDMSSIYQEQRVQPCHLSSSIYYGGQDIYTHSQSTPGSVFNPMVKKDVGEDDSGCASRGNWWQGSLYY